MGWLQGFLSQSLPLPRLRTLHLLLHCDQLLSMMHWLLQPPSGISASEMPLLLEACCCLSPAPALVQTLHSSHTSVGCRTSVST